MCGPSPPLPFKSTPGAAGAVERANELGELLNAHVRFEERNLFPLLEERLSGPDLAELGRAIDAAERH